MPQFLDAIGHQRATTGQKEGADSHEAHSADKTAVSAQLEPGSVGKRGVGSQKHQGEQHGDDDMLRLAERVGQAFWGLGD